MRSVSVAEHVDGSLNVFSQEHQVLRFLSHIALHLKVYHLLHEDLRSHSDQVHDHEYELLFLMNEDLVKWLGQI